MSTGSSSPQHSGHMGDNPAITGIDSFNAVPQFPGHFNWSSYQFLALDEASLEQEDWALLANKGSLSVPDAPALDELVRHYFLHLHPTLPVIDEAGFWESYTQCSAKTAKIPLLVLQAVLFAGCPYINVTTLQRCGFQSKSDARSHFYKRAKLLFDLAEHEPLARTQAAILLSHHASAAEPRAGSDWLTLAIQSAHIIDRLPELSPTVDPMQKKRLWWSIILRDRYLCLILHRRTQVPEIQPGLALDSFDEGVFAREIGNSLVYDAETKAILMKILKEYYELALALSDMMPLVYASHGINTVSLSRDACRDRLTMVKRVKRPLEKWKSSTGLLLLMPRIIHEQATLFGNLIYMYYYVARISLAHFELLIMQQQPEIVSDYDQKLQRTADELYSYMSQQTVLMEYLGHCGSAHVLPLSVLGCLPMPLLTTAINVSLSPSPHQREMHKRTIDTLGQIVEHLEQVYEAAPIISAGMSHFLQLAYTAIQLQSSSDSEPVLRPSQESPTFSDSTTDEPQKTTAETPTWKEFLLQSPRAYLLITTTVDFSLALGQLPRTDSLPDLLTCLLPGSLRICLPWDINPASANHPPNRAGMERSRMNIRSRVRMQHQAMNQAEEAFNLDYLDLSAVR